MLILFKALFVSVLLACFSWVVKTAEFNCWKTVKIVSLMKFLICPSYEYPFVGKEL